MNFVANEVRYVENLLEKKQLTPRKVTKELRLTVQYYLSRGYTMEEAVDCVVAFINQVNDNSSGEKWRKTLNGMAKDLIKKNDLIMRTVDEINFTKEEVEAISSLEKETQRRYAWGILLLCKIVNNGKKSKWLYIEHTNKFCKAVGVILPNAKAREKVFNDLKNAGLLKISKQTGNDSMEVLFAKDEGEIVISFQTYNHLTREENYFENAMNLYGQIFNDKKVYKCQICKAIIQCDTRVKKYCSVCAEEVKRGRVKNEC